MSDTIARAGFGNRFDSGPPNLGRLAAWCLTLAVACFVLGTLALHLLP
jgi:hypothetical protein